MKIRTLTMSRKKTQDYQSCGVVVELELGPGDTYRDAVHAGNTLLAVALGETPAPESVERAKALLDRAREVQVVEASVAAPAGGEAPWSTAAERSADAGEVTVTPTCPHCQRSTALVGGAVVYPHRADMASKKFWLCHPCDAYVGCHPGTERPLGTPAGKALRGMRARVHAALDPLFRNGGRGKAYKWLALEMGIPQEECHVGMFDVDRCLLALDALRRRALLP